MKLVLGVHNYPPHDYHYQFIDDDWVFSDIHPRNPRIELIDARDIPYKDLEAIYASHILEHIKDFDKALKHWHDVLAPGGWVHINVPDIEWALDNLMLINAGEESKSGFYRTREKMNDIFNGTDDAEHGMHLSWFNQTKLRGAMKRAGFRDITVKKVYEAHDMGCLIGKGYK